MSKQSALDTLVAEGMSVYPSGMSGAAAPHSWTTGMGNVPISFHRVKSGKVWGGLGGLANVNKEQATKRLLGWIKVNNPKLYRAVVAKLQREAQRSGSGLGQTTTTTATAEKVPWYQRALDVVTSIAPQYLAYQQQKEILDLQVKRAEQGLPPLQADQYQTAVRVGVDPATVRDTAQETVGAVMRSPLTWLVGGALAYTLVKGKGRRRR